MACPNCSATMTDIGHGTFWCERCGTLKRPDETVYVPRLVESCRDFAEKALPAKRGALWVWWENLGIAESINTPENREGA